MKIEVVIPVVQYELAMALLEQIDANTLLPDRVLLVDNTNKTYPWYVPKNYQLDFLYSTTGRLNESWEVARAKLGSATSHVTFLNDDIVIGDWFFQRVIETFEASKKHAIACPNTLQNVKPDVRRDTVWDSKGPFGPKDVKKGKARFRTQCRKLFEPYAFTIKKDILDTVPPVPWERITTFYGDNWVWAHVMRNGHCWGKDVGNYIYHYVGQTVLERGFRSIKKSEQNEWHQIRREIWDYISYEDRRKNRKK